MASSTNFPPEPESLSETMAMSEVALIINYTHNKLVNYVFLHRFFSDFVFNWQQGEITIDIRQLTGKHKLRVSWWSRNFITINILL